MGPNALTTLSSRQSTALPA